MYRTDATRFQFFSVTVKLSLVSIALFLLSLLCGGLNYMTAGQVKVLALAARYTLAASLALALIAIVLALKMPDRYRICAIVRRGLFHPAYGNPLHLRDGELLPIVRCKNAGPGLYDLIITAQSVTVEDIVNASSSISSMLNKRYEKYAITQANADIAFTYVTFRLENVTIDKSLTFHSLDEVRPSSPTQLVVQQGTYIDLTTSGSMLVAGKTRSGKTTGIISLLLQVLLCGPDAFNSEVTIIDPKRAELSRLPGVVTIDEDGGGRSILTALQKFTATIIKRQSVLNELSEQAGDAVHWWDAGMHPSFLFVDEYVSARTLYPKRAEKDNPMYCIATFDDYIKRIVTMGASAGCYVIISIAEASVEEGGLPAMLRSAMSTRVLFRPTMAEGRLMWGGSNEKLKNFPVDRVYGQGDAWFSSTDGVHDIVSFVHFPRMKFPVYGELGWLLRVYYENRPSEKTPPPSEAEAAAVESVPL